jgi:lysophospholipase L1-like esterase
MRWISVVVGALVLALLAPLAGPVDAAGSASVFVIGDSLTVGARDNGLAQRFADRGIALNGVDAKTGRSTRSGPDVLAAHSTNELGNLVVVALGTNDVAGGVSTRRFRTRMRAVLDAIGPNRTIVWLTVALGDGHTSERQADTWNAVLWDLTRFYPNLRVADWQQVVRSEHFGRDGIHLTRDGYRARATFIADAVARAMR